MTIEQCRIQPTDLITLFAALQEAMLDSLTVKVEQEHGKISGLLNCKEEQLSAAQGRLDVAMKQLDTHSAQVRMLARITRTNFWSAAVCLDTYRTMTFANVS